MEKIELSVKVDKLILINQKITEMTRESETLQGEILMAAEKDLANSKVRTIRYMGSSGNVVTATMSQNVKIVYESMLPDVLGKALSDLTTSKTTLALTSVGKRLLGGIYLKNYITDGLDSVIAQITPVPEKQTLLKKKLKGANPKSDAKTIQNIIGCSEEDAETFAFFVAEAVIWKDFQKILQINGVSDPEQQQKIMDMIDTAVVCEEIPKITIIDVETLESA